MTTLLLEPAKLRLVLLVLMARGGLHAEGFSRGGTYVESNQRPSGQNPINKPSEQTPLWWPSYRQGRYIPGGDE